MGLFDKFKSNQKKQNDVSSKTVATTYNKEILQAKDSNKTEETFKTKLANWKPPVTRPPLKIGDYTLNKKYAYQDVELKVVPQNTIHFEFDMIGKEVTLVDEPENQYDSNAIKVMLNEQKIGYIPKNRLQEMIHDYRKRGNAVYGTIMNVELDEDTEMVEKVFLFIGFYQNPYEDIDKCESISTKLTKTSKKDIFENSRQDNYSYANEGDKIELEYDFNSESYLVCVDGNELGETSTSITKKLQDFDSECNFLGVIDEITEDDSGKFGAKVTIYLKSIV